MGKRSPVVGLAESLLVSISEITASVLRIDIEAENFIEIGSYLYRISPVIMELQSSENTPSNSIEILQSLSQNIDLAKGLIQKFQKGSSSMLYPQTRNTMEQLEMVIKQMGVALSLIPSSTYGDDEYVQIAVQSLVKEMKIARFQVSEIEIPQQRQIVKEGLEETETDLYSVNLEVPMENSLLSITSAVVDQFVEPLYKTFYCPLTKKMMSDPVTIESGVTYERKAITEWYHKFENPEEIFCPKTGKKLGSRVLSTNRALKATIEEWEKRNEATKIKIARAALSLDSTELMVLEALTDLQSMCRRKQYNKLQIRNFGIVPLLAKLLECKDRSVRLATLELLQQLVEDDDEGKEMIEKTIEISAIIKMLSSNHQPIRHASLLLLLELSKSQFVCDKIGSVTGGILMLIKTKYRRSIDAFASEKAGEILKNLEISSYNIKRMAENGHWEPLLDQLIQGCEEMKMEMASYLGELILGHDNKTYVAERASSALIKMVRGGNSLTRNVAFKALNQISAHQSNGKILVEAGLVQLMVEEIFARVIHNEPMNSKNEAASILANILESGLEIENLQVNNHGRTMASDYVVYNIIYMLKNSTPDELNINLIRILLCLVKSPNSSVTIVSVVKETEASYDLIDLINNPNEELVVASVKLLMSLSPFMGHTLAERLCKTRGQPESLIQSPLQTSPITEKMAVSANFLAKLPHQNLTINLALLHSKTVPVILQSIDEIQRTSTRISKYASSYLEGLVGILVRFTTTLYDYQILLLARTHNFTLVFTELLMRTSSDEVQRLSAIGLENLSSQSVILSKKPQLSKTKNMKKFLPKCLTFNSSKPKKMNLCPVHRGACSSQETFCLVDAKAVERLLACLGHENVGVVEAALSAISTLLDDKVDVDKSVSMLNEVDAIKQVLNVVKEHREEGVWKKSFWVIEKFLMKGGDKSTSDISQDKLLPATLVSAFHHGEGSTSQMAEKILRHLNKMPNFTTNFTM
ncbi:hypothetical protein LguiA_032540 [Lonicera macranthoides]